jgi:hypothetical protein
MAYATKPAGADPLAHTIYIWPSQELVARSWDWPEARHVAYEHAASEVGREVAVHVLGGLAIREQSIELRLAAGWISFTVRVFGTSIFVSIAAFEEPDGPDSPGPGGGCEQPRSADGLILGLRGTGKCFSLVTFYGYLPPLPVGYTPGDLARILGWNGITNVNNNFDRGVTVLNEFSMSDCDRSEAAPGALAMRLRQPARRGKLAVSVRKNAAFPLSAGRKGTGRKTPPEILSQLPWRDQTGSNPYLFSGDRDLTDLQMTGLPLSCRHYLYLH